MGSPWLGYLLAAVLTAAVGLVLYVGRRRLEAERSKLQESDEFHTAIADLSADFAFRFGVEPDGTLVIESLSDGFVKLFGHTLEDLSARGGWRSVIHEDDLPPVDANIRRLLEGETVDGHLRGLTREGRMLWLRYRIRPVLAADGRIGGLYGAAQDITRERQAEEKRRESEKREQATLQQLQIVTDTMSAPVTRCSRDLRYLWVSKPYAAWLGRAPEEIVGRPIEEVIGPEAFEMLRPQFEAVLSGETVRYEQQVNFAGLGRRWISAVYTPTWGAAGVPDGWVAVVLDIEERKRAEEALREADQRKDEFLATLAHELRNPLAPIRYAAEILRSASSLESKARSARDIIDRQVQQMVHLVDDLLDVSRISRGRLQVRTEPIELAPVLQVALEASRPAIEAAGLELHVHLPAAPIHLQADSTRLAQVVSNLLNNAAAYTDRGGRIDLTAECRDGMATVSVRDTGIGIAAEHLRRIFEMFSQVKPALERSHGGLGIGLALVKGIVELHGGTVEAASEGPGRGSEFVVRVPAQERPSIDELVHAAAPEANLDRVKRRLLVVEDNEDSAASLAALLRSEGNEVLTAYDGMQAVEMAAAYRPDVVLLDLGLPKLNGYDAARRIRELPGGNETVLIALTGWGQEEDRRRSQAAGFDYHVTKPADPRELLRLIASASRLASGGAVS